MEFMDMNIFTKSKEDLLFLRTKASNFTSKPFTQLHTVEVSKHVDRIQCHQSYELMGSIDAQTQGDRLLEIQRLEEEARALIRELMISSADLRPSSEDNTLRVRIHRMTSPVHDHAIEALLEKINQENFFQPETGMRIRYELS